MTLKKAVFAFNCSISNRAQLAKEMHIEKLMKKNKVFELYNDMLVASEEKPTASSEIQLVICNREPNLIPWYLMDF